MTAMRWTKALQRVLPVAAAFILTFVRRPDALKTPGG